MIRETRPRQPPPTEHVTPTMPAQPRSATTALYATSYTRHVVSVKISDNRPYATSFTRYVVRPRSATTTQYATSYTRHVVSGKISDNRTLLNMLHSPCNGFLCRTVTHHVVSAKVSDNRALLNMLHSSCRLGQDQRQPILTHQRQPPTNTSCYIRHVIVSKVRNNRPSLTCYTCHVV